MLALMTSEDEELFDEWLALRHRITELPGAEVHRELDRLVRSMKVFIGNAADLRGALHHVQDDPAVWLPMLDVNHPERLDSFLEELDRLIHNFLAAAYSFARHSIVLRDARLPDEAHPVRAEYERRSPFARPVCRFVAQLRDVVQHARLPVIQARFEMHTDDGGTQHSQAFFVLSSQALRREHWTGVAREYVEGLGEGDVRLDALTDEYAYLVQEFSRWFIDAVVLEFGQELAELHVLRQRLAAMQPPIDWNS